MDSNTINELNEIFWKSYNSEFDAERIVVFNPTESKMLRYDFVFKIRYILLYDYIIDCQKVEENLGIQVWGSPTFVPETALYYLTDKKGKILNESPCPFDISEIMSIYMSKISKIPNTVKQLIYLEKSIKIEWNKEHFKVKKMKFEPAFIKKFEEWKQKLKLIMSENPNVNKFRFFGIRTYNDDHEKAELGILILGKDHNNVEWSKIYTLDEIDFYFDNLNKRLSRGFK